MITEMVNAGLRVGVTANSHKVIRNLLDEVGRAAHEIGIDLTCIQKVPEEAIDEPRLRFTTDNATYLSALDDDCRVAGGTAWFWSRPDAVDAVDVLFVDEAAQMSLANVLAVSQAAKTVVLLGDPQQLDQPTQGTHPDGVDTPRSTICWVATKPSPWIEGFSWKRPGVSIPRSALSHLNCFTKVGFILVRD